MTDQVRRRFAEYLKSDRTTHRHLAEMEALGLLAAQPVNGVSPLMPKVYCVSGSGLRRLRRSYEQRGRTWQSFALKQRRSEGQSFPHVFHEMAITKFLLAVRQAVNVRPDLKLLVSERRSLAPTPS